MNIYADKIKENKSQSVANVVYQKRNVAGWTSPIVVNRPDAIAQRKLQEMVNNSNQAKQAAQLQAVADNHSAQQQHPNQRKENNTGLPDNLKSGIENLSGYAMDDVKVHFNSPKPVQLNAHAYAQGTDIHIASGQEKYLPHEAWHVVQQKQGRVKPTMQMKGKTTINDDAGLEKEADVMGAKALQNTSTASTTLTTTKISTEVSQRKLIGKAGEGYSGNPQKFVDMLLAEIVQHMGNDDPIVTMALSQDRSITISISPFSMGYFSPDSMEIFLNPNDMAATHEGRDRLYQEGKSPKYDSVNFSELKGKPIGRFGLSTTLYHELGHFYQTLVQGINVAEIYKKAPGKFLIELHNILQTENRLAQKTGEPLRSTYRSPDLKSNEAPDTGKRYKVDKRSIVETAPSEDVRIGVERTEEIKALVNEYGRDLINWMETHGRGIITDSDIYSIHTIFRSAIEVVGENMKESQVHILQGIVDSAYYYLKEHFDGQ